MASVLFSRALVVVRGGGDLASGVIYRLRRAGFPVMVTELESPLLVRRTVSYGDAVYNRVVTVDGLTARLVDNRHDVASTLAAGEIPVVVDPGLCLWPELRPVVIVDGRLAKVNLDTRITDAPLVIGLGPGFTVGADCHVVIETNRGHDLGRVIYQGSAAPDTGEPGQVKGQTHSRVLRASSAGHVRPAVRIGAQLEAGAVIANLNGEPVIAPFSGVLRGLIHEQVVVRAGMKIGDLDPRGDVKICYSISEKSLAVGGGVLEAVLAAPQVRSYLVETDETSTSL
ncbi:MAG: EF2563 family selenium-dependent molybdenum hydroxylase system protein [Anaerolineaceae bacterium]|nr:EF2563 family selenium-dependent molybdenum hydroxylase system protein [Anaerolineaceae bacterium]